MAGYRQTEVKTSYFRSSQIPWHYRKTVSNRIRELVGEDPDKLAFVFIEPGQPRITLTRKELLDLSERLGRHFINLGIEPGDRVATLIHCRKNWIIVQFALCMAGAVVINSPSFDKIEIITMATKMGCVAAIMDNGNLRNNIDERDVILQRLFPSSDQDPEINLSDLIKEPPENVNFPELDADQEVIATFTSGSTGVPKLVVHTHASVLMASFLQAAVLMCNQTDIVVNDRPLHWMGGYPRLYLGSGSCMVYVPCEIISDEESDQFFADVIRSEKVTMVLLMEYKINSLLTRSDLRSQMPIVERGYTGGQRLSLQTAESILTICTKAAVVYGSTECPHFFGFSFDNMSKIEEGLAGYASAGCEVNIIDDDGNIVGIGVEGEVCVRSPAGAKCYLYLDCRKEGIKDENGWYHMGDIGLLRPDRLLIIKGRKSQIIKRGTVKIFPAYVEKKLRENLDISDVVVVGIPDKRLYQDVCACIIPGPRTRLTLEDISQGAKDIFKPFLAPDGLGYMPGKFLLMEEFPLTDTGKINRSVLSQMAANLNLSQ